MSSLLGVHTLRRAWAKFAVFLGLITTLTLGACQVFPFMPNHYTFTRQEAQTALDRKFPFHKHYGQLIDINLSHPVLVLHPESNSVSIALNADFTSPLLEQPVTGGFAINSQLGYDASRQAVILVQPTLEKIDLGELPGVDPKQLNAAASLLATQLLNRYAVYVFKPDQLSFSGVAYEPGAIRVQDDGIQVQIVEKH